MDGPTLLLWDHVSNFLDVRGRIPQGQAPQLAQIDTALGWRLDAFRPPTESLVGAQL